MESPHGDKCSCQILSMAVTGAPGACRYSYCRNVLQHRWEMHCNHGQLPSLDEQPIYDQVVIHEDNTLALFKEGVEVSRNSLRTRRSMLLVNLVTPTTHFSSQPSSR